jgi:hypothetical protein
MTSLLQQFKNMLFGYEFTPNNALTICYEHEYFLEHIFYPSPVRIPMACRKFDKDSRDPKELEELIHLTFRNPWEQEKLRIPYQVIPTTHILNL